MSRIPGRETPMCKDMKDRVNEFSFYCAQLRETDQPGPCPLDPPNLVTRDKIQNSLHVETRYDVSVRETGTRLCMECHL